MPIRPEDAIEFHTLQVTDGQRGFEPHVIAVKRGGVYVDGINPQLMHLSLHHQKNQKDPSLSDCHIRIPRETLPNVNLTDVRDSKFWKWKRLRGVGRRPHNRAALIIFPAQYAKSEFGPIQDDAQAVALHSNATKIEFWYSSSTPAELRQYLDSFGDCLYSVKIPKSPETFGLAIVDDSSGNYAQAQTTPDHATLNFVKDGDAPEQEPTHRLHVGPYGKHCYGLMYGQPEDLGPLG